MEKRDGREVLTNLSPPVGEHKLEALVIFTWLHLHTSKGNTQLLYRNYLSAAVTATLNITSNITNTCGQEYVDFLQMKIIPSVG